MAKRTSAQIRREIEERAIEVLEKVLPGIEGRVVAMIDARLQTIVGSAIGMDMEWGNCRVDHCNGRKTEIANRIGALAMERVSASFDRWLAQVAPDGRMPKGWRKAIRDEYEEQISWKLRDRIDAHVRSIATSDVERMVAEALSVDVPVADIEEG